MELDGRRIVIVYVIVATLILYIHLQYLYLLFTIYTWYNALGDEVRVRYLYVIKYLYVHTIS